MKKDLIIIITVIFIISCKTEDNSSVKDSQLPVKTRITNYGSSGMTQVNDSTFIVVYDLKNFQAGTRLGLIEVTKDVFNVKPISISFWDSEGISNDLESICAIPDKKDEYLAAESGNWQCKYGRIFHIKVNMKQQTATVISSFKPPIINPNDIGQIGDQYEGIHCIKKSSTEYIIILAERGGSKLNPDGILRWGLWNTTTNKFTFSDKGLNGIAVKAPGNWINPKYRRSLADLYVDSDNNIWAAASDDPGDLGPFYSVIYKLGRINISNTDLPFSIISNPKVGKHINGFKIESLAGPAKKVNSTHSFGTEDENYGGVWRPIIIK